MHNKPLTQLTFPAYAHARNALHSIVRFFITVSCNLVLEALMDWALQAAHQQHAQAVADAYAAAEAAQKSGEGPKPMMVTPYKHNWVISGTHPEHESPEEEKYVYL